MRTLCGMPEDSERRVGRAEATRLLAPYPLPKPGYETVVADAAGVWDSKHQLFLGNYGGEFALTCCSAGREQWLELFGVA